MPTPTKYRYRPTVTQRDHYLRFLSSIDQTATPDQILSYHRSYLQKQNLPDSWQFELLKDMDRYYRNKADSRAAKLRFIMMIISSVTAVILLTAGIALLLVTPGTQPVAAVGAAVMIALGAGAAMQFFITAIISFEYRQKPLDTSHSTVISVLLKEHGATIGKNIGLDHGKHAEQTSSSELGHYHVIRSLMGNPSGDQVPTKTVNQDPENEDTDRSQSETHVDDHKHNSRSGKNK